MPAQRRMNTEHSQKADRKPRDHLRFHDSNLRSSNFKGSEPSVQGVYKSVFPVVVSWVVTLLTNVEGTLTFFCQK